VVVETAGRGGRSGQVYKVRADSLPAELQQRLKGLQGPCEGASEGHFPAPAATVTASDFAPRPNPRLRDQLALLRPVLATEPATAARAAATTEAAARGRISESTVRRWLERHQRLGIAGLSRRRRADAGAAKGITWRSLDRKLRAAGRTDQEIAELAERIRRHVRGLLADTSASRAMIAHISIGFVAEQLRAAGATVAQDETIAVCRPSAEFVRAERRFRLLEVYRHDAGRFAAKIEPRIRRDRSHLRPLEEVAGDVAHLDVQLRRADGSIATPKAVAFQELSTNRLFVRLYLLEKGEGIRREMVLETFCAMCTDPSWGVPTRLLIDNGSEFGKLDLASDLFQLKCTLEETAFSDPGVQRARPYNPQSKVIETSFSILNARLLPLLPGFIGGNRMTKKTQMQGRDPAPYQGTFEQLEGHIGELLDCTTRSRNRSGRTSPASPRTSASASISPTAGSRRSWSMTAGSARCSAPGARRRSTPAVISSAMGRPGATTT
jgi:hypothetical protein